MQTLVCSCTTSILGTDRQLHYRAYGQQWTVGRFLLTCWWLQCFGIKPHKEAHRFHAALQGSYTDIYFVCFQHVYQLPLHIWQNNILNIGKHASQSEITVLSWNYTRRSIGSTVQLHHKAHTEIYTCLGGERFLFHSETDWDFSKNIAAFSGSCAFVCAFSYSPVSSVTHLDKYTLQRYQKPSRGEKRRERARERKK